MLSDLLAFADQGKLIDPNLLHYCFEFGVSHLNHQSPDGMKTVFYNDENEFQDVTSHLRTYLVNRFCQLRYAFPFGHPEGFLKSSLILLDRVVKYTKGTEQDVIDLVDQSLIIAANLAVQRITQKAQFDIILTQSADINAIVEVGVLLAELATDVSKEVAECYVEGKDVHIWWLKSLSNHLDHFWELLKPYFQQVLDRQPPDTWDVFPIFHQINDFMSYSKKYEYFKIFNGSFHIWLCDQFAPITIRYFDLIENNILNGLKRGIKQENWVYIPNVGCSASGDILWKIETLWNLIAELSWPQLEFARHLNARLLKITNRCVYTICALASHNFISIENEKISFDARLSDSHTSMLCTMVHCREFIEKMLLLVRSEEFGLDQNGQKDDIDKFKEIVEYCDEQINKAEKILRKSVFEKMFEVLLNKMNKFDEGGIISSVFSFAPSNLVVSTGKLGLPGITESANGY